MNNFFHDQKGKASMLRLIAFCAVCAGMSMIVCGNIGFFLQLPGWENLIYTGSGLSFGGNWVKSWQKKIESGTPSGDGVEG